MRLSAFACMLLWSSGVIRAQAPTVADETLPYVLPELLERAAEALRSDAHEQAAADLSLFILFNPTHAAAHYQRAAAYQSLDHLPEAARDYADWLRLAGSDVRQIEAPETGIPQILAVEPGVTYGAAIPLDSRMSLNVIASNASGAVDPLVVLISPAREPLLASDDASASDTSAIIDGYRPVEAGSYTLLITQTPPQTSGEIILVVEAR